MASQFVARSFPDESRLMFDSLMEKSLGTESALCHLLHYALSLEIPRFIVSSDND